MQLPPLEVILSWPTPNYVDPKDVRGPHLLILNSILFPLALLTVALRTFTRLGISKSFGADDWFLLAAIIPTAACAVLSSLAEQRWGWNRHIWDVPPDLVTLGLKLIITMECAFALAVSLTKLSMLILTRRILTNGTGVMRHVAAILIFIVATEAVVFCLVVICTCSPPSAYWTLSAVPQHCINEKLHLVIGGCINTFTDFGVVFLPLPTVLRLKINRSQQIVLVGLFGAGFAICIAGIFRIYFTLRTADTYDRTWLSFGLWISSMIELYVGQICTAVPACKPFFSHYLPTLFASVPGTSRLYENSHSASLPGPTKPSKSHISQEKRFSQTSEYLQPHELQDIPKSRFSTKVVRSSSNLLPLSYLDSPEAPESGDVKRSSNATSISSFIGSNSAQYSSEFHASGPSTLERGFNRSDSIEELVETRN